MLKFLALRKQVPEIAGGSYFEFWMTFHSISILERKEKGRIKV